MKAGRQTYTHEIAIDNIASQRWGEAAIAMLYDFTEELEYCPDDKELERLARSLVLTVAQVELVTRKAASRNRRIELSKVTKLKKTKGKIGFVRRA